MVGTCAHYTRSTIPFSEPNEMPRLHGLNMWDHLCYIIYTKSRVKTRESIIPTFHHSASRYIYSLNVPRNVYSV